MHVLLEQPVPLVGGVLAAVDDLADTVVERRFHGVVETPERDERADVAVFDRPD